MDAVHDGVSAYEYGCSGDEYAVRQLVSILLDNAIKYAPAGTASYPSEGVIEFVAELK